MNSQFYLFGAFLVRE